MTEMVTEARLELPEGALDALVDTSIVDTDPLDTGGISPGQFEALVARYPGIASHMHDRPCIFSCRRCPTSWRRTNDATARSRMHRKPNNTVQL